MGEASPALRICGTGLFFCRDEKRKHASRRTFVDNSAGLPVHILDGMARR